MDSSIQKRRETKDLGFIIRNVHNFDQTKGLDPQTKELLNSKIDQVTEMYNQRMTNLNNRNYQLFEQYNKLKIITGDSF